MKTGVSRRPITEKITVQTRTVTDIFLIADREQHLSTFNDYLYAHLKHSRLLPKTSFAELEPYYSDLKTLHSKLFPQKSCFFKKLLRVPYSRSKFYLSIRLFERVLLS